MVKRLSSICCSTSRQGVDANGRLIAFHSASYTPHQSDARLLGALLAGMPCSMPKPGSWIATEWPYDKIQNRLEEAYGMPSIGARIGNRRSARQHHAHAGSAAAEFCAGRIDQRGRCSGGRRSCAISARPHDRPTPDRYAEGHGKGGGMGTATIAASEGSQDREQLQ